MKQFLMMMTGILISVISFGQVYQIMPQYGYDVKRMNFDSTLQIPTICGVPTLKSNVTKKSAIAYDSCGGKFYVYNPSTTSWDTIAGGGGGSTIDTTNRFVNNVTKVNDSTIRVWKGDTATDIEFHQSVADSGVGTLQQVLTRGNVWQYQTGDGYQNLILGNGLIGGEGTGIKASKVGGIYDGTFAEFGIYGTPYFHLQQTYDDGGSDLYYGFQNRYFNRWSLLFQKLNSSNRLYIGNDGIEFVNSNYGSGNVVLYTETISDNKLTHWLPNTMPNNECNVCSDTLATTNDIRNSKPYYELNFVCEFNPGNDPTITSVYSDNGLIPTIYRNGIGSFELHINDGIGYPYDFDMNKSNMFIDNYFDGTDYHHGVYRMDLSSSSYLIFETIKMNGSIRDTDGKTHITIKLYK